MMKSCSHFPALLLLLLLVAACCRVPPAESVTCSPYELLPCVGAIMYSVLPSDQCCSTLREQQPCLCQYIRDPTLGSYVNSPNSHRVADACRLPFPRC
ncbi:hypothetical protein Taro_024463 [Colocasia esculenta]|uniref:Bifunctional inhibitor/plant lipid transfer protein/seed storage helical domain-containing protein n=1 Tax=Colocasia esculenta TaxID=4460 RepID=A0A843VBD9_COLES|nr:hypothetical protein [Colocasia esculenta]